MSGWNTGDDVWLFSQHGGGHRHNAGKPGDLLMIPSVFAALNPILNRVLVVKRANTVIETGRLFLAFAADAWGGRGFAASRTGVLGKRQAS